VVDAGREPVAGPGVGDQADILLTTFNARYIHTAFGLRYLRANLAELRPRSRIVEFGLEQGIAEVAEQLLCCQPRIIGLGVYIWNVEQSARLVRLLKRLAPDVVLVLGGPEVSHEWQQQRLVAQADYLITGQADLAFADLCRRILGGATAIDKVLQAQPPALTELAYPYAEYTDDDLAHRVLYVEASRGCPFRCEFCLSALDRTALSFCTADFLQELTRLYARGARQFKFVDRTFNLNPRHSGAILDFLLAHRHEGIFAHFEVIPDRLPVVLKERLAAFPAGALQLEIGVQSLNPEVQQLISRKQDNRATLSNLAWLKAHTHAHLHADLIVGLPGETIDSFASGFDQLVALQLHEIQVGVLKRLRGAPISRHTRTFDMRYDPDPPYEIMSTDRIDFAQMQRMKRFARYWDRIANSGRFVHSLPLILADAPFGRFLQLSDWLYRVTGQSTHLALKRLFDLLYQGMCEVLSIDAQQAGARLAQDFARSGVKGRPAFMASSAARSPAMPVATARANRRQGRHLPVFGDPQ
jgi:radical SAM superfamily enzyme YgiQ (UPF0313 family)